VRGLGIGRTQKSRRKGLCRPRPTHTHEDTRGGGQPLSIVLALNQRCLLVIVFGLFPVAGGSSQVCAVSSCSRGGAGFRRKLFSQCSPLCNYVRCVGARVLCTSMYVCVRACVCVCVYVCVSLRVCVCGHTTNSREEHVIPCADQKNCLRRQHSKAGGQAAQSEVSPLALLTRVMLGKHTR